MTAIGVDLAIEWSASALKRVGDSIPVDVRSACRIAKLWVRFEELPEDTRGFLLKTPARWYAVVNSRRSQESRRWILAHELCEYMLVRRQERRGRVFKPRDRVECEDDRHEQLCNRFAALLLMPEARVRDLAAELHHSPRNNKTAVLAGRFGVSEQAMQLRLRELRLLPRGRATR